VFAGGPHDWTDAEGEAIVAFTELVALLILNAMKASERGRVAAQPLHRPRELVRRGLVAGREHRHELVADLLVGQLAPQETYAPRATPADTSRRRRSLKTPRGGAGVALGDRGR